MEKIRVSQCNLLIIKFAQKLIRTPNKTLGMRSYAVCYVLKVKTLILEVLASVGFLKTNSKLEKSYNVSLADVKDVHLEIDRVL